MGRTVHQRKFIRNHCFDLTMKGTLRSARKGPVRLHRWCATCESFHRHSRVRAARHRYAGRVPAPDPCVARRPRRPRWPHRDRLPAQRRRDTAQRDECPRRQPLATYRAAPDPVDDDVQPRERRVEYEVARGPTGSTDLARRHREDDFTCASIRHAVRPTHRRCHAAAANPRRSPTPSSPRRTCRATRRLLRRGSSARPSPGGSP